jgi:hypothetical protein
LDRYSKFVIDPLTLVVLALAVAGVTRLLVHEKITERYRQAVLKRFGEGSLITYGVYCVFCTGFHISWMLTIPTFWLNGGSPWAALLTFLAVYATAPHLADWGT